MTDRFAAAAAPSPLRLALVVWDTAAPAPARSVRPAPVPSSLHAAPERDPVMGTPILMGGPAIPLCYSEPAGCGPSLRAMLRIARMDAAIATFRVLSPFYRNNLAE